MPTHIAEVIYLGNFTDADWDESTSSVETQAPYLGVHGSSGNPLHNRQLDMTFDDANDSGDILTDNVAPTETLEYDLGGGPITAEVDSLAVVSLQVTYANGAVISYTNAVMFQDTTGNLFLTNSNFAGTDLNGPALIESINVTSISSTNYTGLFHQALQDFVCFHAGTLIQTPSGKVQVQELQIGDWVVTRDHGPQQIRWVGHSPVQRTEKTAPIVIEAGSLAPGVPERDLRVSRQHRIMLKSAIAERMFGLSEIMVPAHYLHLVPGVKLSWEHEAPVYSHILLDRHEAILADGAYSESLFISPQSLKLMGDAARQDLLTKYPGLMRDQKIKAARPTPLARRIRKLIGRHQKNNRALFA